MKVGLWNVVWLFIAIDPLGTAVVVGVVDPLFLDSDETIQPALSLVHGEKGCGQVNSAVKVEL